MGHARASLPINLAMNFDHLACAGAQSVLGEIVHRPLFS
jgi:hypothetical protein